ncbi:MAG: SIMPL domain-containing protein [Deltaproteobacteria bacterium]|nr:SIMPL domain-containing protein [Deltaproteobacteria bacterium]
MKTFQLSLLICLFACPLLAQAQENRREIAVQGEASATYSPNHVKLTFHIEASGQNAQAVNSALNQKLQEVIKIISVKDKNIEIYSRGRDYSGPDGRGSTILANNVVTAIEYLTVETTNVSLSAQIIDDCLKAGAANVGEVSYRHVSTEEQRISLIKKATDTAKAKALAIAENLNVKLGQPIAITVNEEDLGSQMLEQRMRGENPSLYHDKKLSIQVLVRYELLVM